MAAPEQVPAPELAPAPGRTGAGDGADGDESPDPHAVRAHQQHPGDKAGNAFRAR